MLQTQLDMFNLEVLWIGMWLMFKERFYYMFDVIFFLNVLNGTQGGYEKRNFCFLAHCYIFYVSRKSCHGSYEFETRGGL
jgi:hypothetical protein